MTEQTMINFEIVMPTGQVMDYCDDKYYSKGDEAICVLTNDIMISGYELMETPFTINVYDDSWNEIGSFYDIASHWWSDEE